MNYLCIGGPLAGHTLWLRSASTLVFSLAGRRGYYTQVPNGITQATVEWVEA